MNAAIGEIEAQADRIEDAYETIERALLDVETANGWAVALGFVESAVRRGYRLRKLMLSEAIERSAEYRWKENENDETIDPGGAP